MATFQGGGEATLSTAFSAITTSLAQDVEPASPQQIRVARLIRDLGAPTFSTRDTAARELSEMGDAPARQLEMAAQSDDAVLTFSLLGGVPSERSRLMNRLFLMGIARRGALGSNTNL